MNQGCKYVWCVDSPGWGGSEVNLLRVLKMTDSSQICILHSVHASPEFLRMFENRKGWIRPFFDGRATLRSLFAGLAKAFCCTREYPGALFVVWSHHLDSNRWLQLGLALSMARFILVEQLVPSDGSAF